MKYANSEKAPTFPFLTHASRSKGGDVRTAGFVGIIPGSNPPQLADTVEEQTALAMGYAEAALMAVDAKLKDIGRVLIFHTQREDSAAITRTYVDFLNDRGVPENERPPRAALGASFLPLDALVEILVDAEAPGSFQGNLPEALEEGL